MSEPLIERGTHVVVDDQLALLATLGLLILPEGVHGTLTTTYAWQLRLTQALVSGRATEGTLQRVVAMADVSPAEALARITRPDPTLLDVIDPRPLVWEVAALRVEHPSQTSCVASTNPSSESPPSRTTLADSSN